MGKILLIDAYSQIYRLFFAIRMLNNPAGEPVNALYGMARLFLQLDELFPADFGALVFDLGKCSRRTALLPEYKAQRPPMPDALRAQTGPIRKWAEAFGWHIVQREGFEADDLICGIVSERGGHQASILSADKDLYQLLKDGEVSMIVKGPAPKIPWSLAGEAAALEKFGVKPEQLGDYLALLGDSSDNIPGIPGVGPKTAVKLLQEHGDLAHLAQELDSVSPEKLRRSLSENAAMLLRNRSLVQLDKVLPEGWSGLESIRRRQPDWRLLEAMAEEEGFGSLKETIAKRRAAGEVPTQGMLF